MSDGSKSSSAMAFILGAVVVILGGVIWYISTGGDVPGNEKADIEIDLPGVEIVRE